MKHLKSINEFYNRTIGYRYSDPKDEHCEYIMSFSIDWRISKSTLTDLFDDFLKEQDIFKYKLDIDMYDEDQFHIKIEFNSYSDKEANYLMNRMIEFFPDEIEFENISFGPKIDRESIKLGYVKSNESMKYYELASRIDKIINSNLKEIKYEGTEVDKHGMKVDILELIYEICPEFRPKYDNLDS